MSPDLFAVSLPQIDESPELPPIETAPETVSNKRQQGSLNYPAALDEIRNATGLNAAQIVILTLFDALPLVPIGGQQKNLGCQNRSAVSVAASALKVNLLQQFGWNAPTDLLNGWRENVQLLDPFIRYHGSVSGTPTYRRTSNPLPWAASALFTETQISAYLTQISEFRKASKK